VARPLLIFLPLLLAGCLEWPEELMRPDGANSDNQSPSCPVSCINLCSQGVCEIDCRKDACVCPAGYPCEAQCDAKGDCPGAIDCTQATSCTIHCEADSSCAGRISCGPGFCSVRCSGWSSCAAGVDCEASCGCAVQASPSATVLCPAACKNGCRTINNCDNC
jgi:hypothetical protein